MSDPVTAAIIMAATTAVATGTQTAVSAYEAEESRKAQSQAQEAARQQQEKADRDAEKQRLEGIAANQAATNYGSVWGGSEAKRYADAAQKLSAGTGAFSDDDKTNPFYSRGLI